MKSRIIGLFVIALIASTQLTSAQSGWGIMGGLTFNSSGKLIPLNMLSDLILELTFSKYALIGVDLTAAATTRDYEISNIEMWSDVSYFDYQVD